MQKKSYKGRCERRTCKKSKDICRLYSKIQAAYLVQLERKNEIEEIQCNEECGG